jgi:hypothetical protein
MREFQATGQERLQAVIPPANTRPVRGFSREERGFAVQALDIIQQSFNDFGFRPYGHAMDHL